MYWSLHLTVFTIDTPTHAQRGWPAVVGGFAAGLTSFIDDPSRRHTLSLFVIARALGALITTLHRRGQLPTIPHFVVLMFGLCQSFIIYSVVRYPELLPVGYYRSLLRWSVSLSDEKFRVSIVFCLYISASLYNSEL